MGAVLVPLAGVSSSFVEASHQDGGDEIVDLPEADDRASGAGLEESRGVPGELDCPLAVA